jgi:hypothetical protein
MVNVLAISKAATSRAMMAKTRSRVPMTLL